MGSFTLIKKRDLDGPVVRSEPLPLGHIFVMAIITAAAFAARYWFNFYYPHVNAYNSCDASEYLANGRAIVEAFALPRTFWRHALSCLMGHAAPDVVAHLRAQLAPLYDLKISGPIFPLFLALCTAIGNKFSFLAQWIIPLAAQSILSALTCLFIGLTASRAYNKRAGYVAALIAAAYPAFIINSGRLYSETFAAFLLSALCYQIVRGCTQTVSDRSFTTSSVLTGALAACLQLTRSLMVSVTALSVPFVIFQQGMRKGCFGLIGFILGFWLIIMPWLGFQKIAFGSASLVVDRVSHYNLFVGNNIMTQGWLSVPYPDGRGIEDKPLIELLKDSYHQSPSHFWTLLLDKQLRLWEAPWNDFRVALGAIPYAVQIWWHQATLVLAIIGSTLGLVAGRKSHDDDYDLDSRHRHRDSTAAKLFLLLVLCVHFAYLLFITVPRYNLTAMVVACMLAGAGIDALLRLATTRSGPFASLMILTTTAMVIVVPKLPFVNITATLAGGDHAFAGLVIGHALAFCTLLCLGGCLIMAVSAFTDRQFGQKPRSGTGARLFIVVATVFCAPSFILQGHASGRWYEWQAPMYSGGRTLTQTFTLPANFKQTIAGRQLYLLVDADSGTRLHNLKISVNGTNLDAPAIPGLSLVGDLSRYHVQNNTIMHEVEWIFTSLCQAAGRANTDLRQWYIYPLSQDLLGKTAALKVEITAPNGKGATIFGTYDTDAKNVSIPAVGFASWEKAFYGVENPTGFSDARYDYHVSAAPATKYDIDLSDSAGMQTGRYNIHLLAGPVVNSEEPAPAASSNQAAESTDGTDSQPETPTPASTPPGQTAVLLDKRVSLSQIPTNGKAAGWTETVPKDGQDHLWIVRVSGEARRNNGAANVEVYIGAPGQNKQTYLSAWSAPIVADGVWRTFNVSVPIQYAQLPNKADTLLVNLAASPRPGEAQPDDAPVEVKNVRLQIWRLPANPVDPGYLVF